MYKNHLQLVLVLFHQQLKVNNYQNYKDDQKNKSNISNNM